MVYLDNIFFENVVCHHLIKVCMLTCEVSNLSATSLTFEYLCFQSYCSFNMERCSIVVMLR